MENKQKRKDSFFFIALSWDDKDNKIKKPAHRRFV
jgi:hypothetical protein